MRCSPDLSINCSCAVCFQLLDAFGHKSNISLVFDFMETDLEVRQFLTFG